MFRCRLESVPLHSEPLMSSHYHSLNISVNALLNVEVVLNPTSETQPFIEQLLIIERLQVGCATQTATDSLSASNSVKKC